MPQEPADILSYHLFLDVEVDQAIPLVTQATIIKIVVEREKCRPVQFVQKRNYFLVFHAHPTNILANLPKGDTPTPQECVLTLGNVFIQDVHAGSGSWAYSIA